MPKSGAQISKSYRLRNSEKVRARDRARKRRVSLQAKARKDVDIYSSVAVLEPPEPVQAVEDDRRDLAADLFRWSEDVLRVPPIHQNQGRPMKLAGYIKSFLSDCLDPGVSEVALIISRKNSKTTAHGG